MKIARHRGSEALVCIFFTLSELYFRTSEFSKPRPPISYDIEAGVLPSE
jgi:hypothetical protein